MKFLIFACVVLCVVVAVATAQNITFGRPLIPNQGGGTVTFKNVRTFPHAQTQVDGAIKKLKFYTNASYRWMFMRVDNGIIWTTYETQFSFPPKSPFLNSARTPFYRPNLTQLLPTGFYEPADALGQAIVDYEIIGSNMVILAQSPFPILTRYNWTQANPSIIPGTFAGSNPKTLPGNLADLMGLSYDGSRYFYIISGYAFPFKKKKKTLRANT